MKHLNLYANVGTIAGLLAALLFLVMGITGINPFEGASLGISLVPVIFIAIGTKKVRELENNDMPFGKAFKTGLYIAFFYASLYAILVYLYLNFFGDAMVEQTKNSTLDKLDMVEGKMPTGLYNKAVESAEKITAGTLALGRYWNNLIWGVLVSLVTAIIYKKNPDPFDVSENSAQ